MRQGERLHALIRSLELNERRYFKLQASLQKRSSILSRLFDFLSDEVRYDENAVRAHFEGEKFLEQLSVTQNHLSEMILRSMRMYHLNNSVDFKLRGMLQDVQFLYEKGLKDQAQRTLRRVRKQALEHDRFAVVLEVLDWETRFLAAGFHIGKNASEIDRISEEYYDALGRLQNEREYADLQSKIFSNFYHIGAERQHEGYRTNEDIIHQFAMRQPQRALTFTSKCRFLNIRAQYHKINGDWEQAYQYRSDLLKLIELRAEKDKSRPMIERLILATTNLFPLCVKLCRWKELQKHLNRLRGFEARFSKIGLTEVMRDRIRMHSLIAEVVFCTHTGAIHTTEDVLATVKAVPGRIMARQRMFLQLHLAFNVGYLLFTQGRYSEVLSWLNKVSNNGRAEAVEDLLASTRMLELLAHYELGRGELLQYLTRAAKRYFNNFEGIYQFETVMLDFMRTQSKTKEIDRAELIGQFTELRKQLEKVGYEIGDRNAYSAIDLIAWTDSKLQGRSMHLVLKEKNRQQ